MSLTTQWYVPDHVVLFAVHGKFKVRDMRRARVTVQQALATHNHTIHVVFDLRHMKLAIPSRKDASPQDMDETRAVLAHPRLGWMIGVSDNWLMRLAQKMAEQRDMRMCVVADLSQLDATLRDVDAGLAPLLQRELSQQG